MKPSCIVKSLFLALTTSAPLYAQDYCQTVITERAFDRFDSSTAESVVFATRADLCDNEYSNIGEAQSSARKAGFNVGYSGFTVGGSGAKQNNSGKWDISESSFCTASATDLKTIFGGSYQSVIANAAVSAWVDCVKAANSNALFLDYEVSRDGRMFSGTLRTTASAGTLERTITGIAAVGKGKDGLRCNIGGIWYEPEAATYDPIEIKQTGTSIACEKNSDESAQVALQTSADSTPFVTLPSPSDIELAEWDKVKTQMDADRQAVHDLSATLEAGLGALKSQLSTFQNRKWVAPSRQKGVSYVNELDYPIEVAVSSGPANGGYNFCHVQAFLDGSGTPIASSIDNNPQYAKLCSIYFTVPPKSSYVVVIDGFKPGGLSSWWELR